MSLKYKIIRIFTSEEVHWHGKPLYNAVIEYIRSLKLAARCTIYRGIAGCYDWDYHPGRLGRQSGITGAFRIASKIGSK